MRYLGILILGLVIGFLVGHNRKPEVKVVTKVEACEPAPQQQAETPPPVTQPAADDLPSAIPPQPKQPEKVSVTFTTSMVEQMERNWEDLDRDIRLRREAQGWRVISLDRNSPAAQAGLVEGDFISDITLEKMQDEQLAERLMRVFARVSF